MENNKKKDKVIEEKEISKIPEGYIAFSELINKIKDLNSGIIKGEEFKEWLDKNLIISPTIDSATQYFIIENIFINNPMLSQEGSVDRTKQIEIVEFYDILLSYTNLYVELKDKNLTNIDTLISVNLDEYILRICNKSYMTYVTRFEKSLSQDAINLTLKTLNSLTEVLENLGNQMQESTEGFQSGLEKLTPEMLDRVSHISEFNNPVNKELMGYIQKESLNDSNVDLEELKKQLEDLKSMPFNEAFAKNPELAKKSFTGCKK